MIKKYLIDNKKLMQEWDWNNNDIDPKNLTIGSEKKVWWIGKCGHKWQATIYHRATRNQKCPYCKNINAGITRKINSLKKKGSLKEKNLIYFWNGIIKKTILILTI